MKVKIINNKKELKKFINMPDSLYKGDKLYVPYMKSDLFKNLNKLVLIDKTYTALVVEENNRYIARVLFTIHYSKQLKLDRCGFFSMFESINNHTCVKLLFDEVKKQFKIQNISYLEGTFYPYDQDNRRGIQISGFDDEPLIFTSYNKDYYKDLLEEYGFKKDFDTFAYKHNFDEYDFERVNKVKNRILKMSNIKIEKANFKEISNEINDIHKIMEKATNDIIFQEAPTIEELENIVSGWKNFLWDDLILIARRKEDNYPVGFVMAIPNYYFVFRKMKGKLNLVSLIKMIYYKNKIKSMRIMLQYVIPEYQNKGINYLLYNELFISSKKRGINYVESGTIMENNIQSRQNTEKAGGINNKIFRIYGLEI